MIGDWIAYHDNGQKARAEVYYNGRIHGPYRSWYPNGQRREEGEFVQGKREGQWKAWNEDGSTDETLTGFYKNDRKARKEDQ